MAERIKHELLELVPPAIFFLIAFHLLTVTRALMLRQYGVRVSALAGATIGALLVAKVVLVADLLPAVNRFPQKPLIYNVVWKTAIYVVGAVLVHYLEHLIPVWWREGSLVAANRRLVAEVIWPHFWVVQIWLVVLLFVYCTMREFVHALGAQKVKVMFFGGGEPQRP
jgi:hypothetical protein